MNQMWKVKKFSYVNKPNIATYSLVQHQLTASNAVLIVELVMTARYEDKQLIPFGPLVHKRSWVNRVGDSI